nr:YbdD/YjiX family protein [Mycolicibacterium sp. GF69]
MARKIGWYWRTFVTDFVGDLMGDTHYRRYVEHRLRTHPGEPVLSEREYWRMRHAAADANPSARCC